MGLGVKGLGVHRIRVKGLGFKDSWDQGLGP